MRRSRGGLRECSVSPDMDEQGGTVPYTMGPRGSAEQDESADLVKVTAPQRQERGVKREEMESSERSREERNR